MTPLRVIISLLFAGVATAAFLDFMPTRLAVSSMAGVTVLSALSRLFLDKSINLPLAWETGFLVVIVTEALQSQVPATPDYPIDSYRYAVQLLMLGHAFVVVTADAVHGESLAGSGPTWVGGQGGTRLSSLPVLIVSLCALSYLIPTAFAALQYGRASTLAEVGPLSAMLNSAGMVAPALIAVRFRNGNRRSLIVSYLVASPILLAQMAIGTRYSLLFAILGPLIVFLGPRLDRVRDLVMFGVAAGILVVTSSLMLMTRGAGLQGDQEFGSGQIQLSNEGVVVNMARVIHYFESQTLLFGASAASVVTVGIPRSLWPDKPTLLGYWFPRAYGLEGFSEVHSISVGYVGDGYADFGFFGVVLYCVLLGSALGVAQRFCDRSFGDGGDIARAYAAILFPAAFFAVRSPVTTLINVIGIGVVVLMIHILSSWAATARVGEASTLSTHTKPTRKSLGVRRLAVRSGG